jgi:hypothetical protein
MFEVNCRVWYAWTSPSRTPELPVVVKFEIDKNKNYSMFEVNCRVWSAWTSHTGALELPMVVKMKSDLNNFLACLS